MGLYKQALAAARAAESNEPDAVKDVRTSLAKLLKADRTRSVFYMTDEGMPTQHVVPYAKQVLKWHGGADKLGGLLDMYFDDNGYPIGYGLDGEDGIHTDAGDDKLMKAKIVSMLSKNRAKQYGLL